MSAEAANSCELWLKTYFKNHTRYYIPTQQTSAQAPPHFCRGEVLLVNNKILKDTEYKVKKLTINEHSCLTLHTNINGAEHIIWGIHGPHSDKHHFWACIGELAEDFPAEGKRVTILGDLNVVSDPSMDRARPDTC